jgi:acetylornithine deacetylase/succinyl-diaminopimelate desuccinylase-like protein
MEIHGIGGGFTQTRAKTVIPASVTAKCSFRIVPDQDPEAIIQLFETFVKENAVPGVVFEVCGCVSPDSKLELLDKINVAVPETWRFPT